MGMRTVLRGMRASSLIAIPAIAVLAGCSSSSETSTTQPPAADASSEEASIVKDAASELAPPKDAQIDAPVVCPSGQLLCGSACVMPNLDPKNCGSCGKACAPTEVCDVGKCSSSCGKGLTACDGACRDLTTDPNNCGTCAKACSAGESCVQGVCKFVCPAGQTLCDGACVTLFSDAKNCGKCGTACAQGESCVEGLCKIVCPAGQSACDGACVSLSADPKNCGVCGTSCAPTDVCSNGTCANACAADLTPCNGACRDLSSDLKNCGACGKACAEGESCVGGTCKILCPPGQTLCDQACVTLPSDPKNCGACAKTCAATEVCSAGTCTNGCAADLTACDGACRDLSSDPKNCGACGKLCTPAYALGLCNQGSCAIIQCTDGHQDCNAQVADGCEVSPMTDPDHCGSCANECSYPHAIPVCAQGVCAKADCDLGFADCDGVLPNGCEIDTQIDPAHCGSCGKKCEAPNALTSCVAGACTIESCNGTFADCNKELADGCEAELQSDLANCGACGNVCAQGDTCCAGKCVSPTVFLTAPADCGVCGKNCGAGGSCCGGQCVASGGSNPCPSCNTACNGTTITGADFGTGTVKQLEADSDGLSTIPAAANPPITPTPFVWVAMHDSHQVDKLDANTGAVLGVYSSRGQNPSRGVVALDDSFWIGNRCPADPNNPACSNVAQILPDGTEGCTVAKAADGAPLPFVRALSIDADGFIWAGTWNDHRAHKIDPKTCKTVLDIDMVKNGQVSYPYSFAIDSKGILWNSDLGSGSVWMGINTRTGTVDYTVNHGARTAYGIAIDRSDNIYFAQWSPCYAGVWRVDGITRAITDINPSFPDNSCTRGLAVDANGDIWATVYRSSTWVSHFKGGTGAFVGSYPVPNIGYGVGIAGDTFGNLWVTGTAANNVVRFPQNPGVSNGQTIPVSVTKALTGSYPYNYSDWGGLLLRTVTCKNAQIGTWTRDFDSGSDTAAWQSASWTANTPPGTWIKVTFQAAASVSGLDTAARCGPFFTSPVSLSTCNFGVARHLRAIVELGTNNMNVQPSVSDLAVFNQ